MGTILDSVNNLSDKLGVTAREQTIKDQLDLCVERLGGEGNSVDIAESANKFADKEDGTATFTTKAITENGTYDATDDGVSGYSSVTVDVSGGVSYAFSSIFVLGQSAGEPYILARCYNPIDDNGTFNVTFDAGSDLSTSFGSYAVLSQPAKKVNITEHVPTGKITFTPAADFDGFYNGSTKRTLMGDNIVPGDGRAYTLNYNAMSGTYNVTAHTGGITSE